MGERREKERSDGRFVRPSSRPEQRGAGARPAQTRATHSSKIFSKYVCNPIQSVQSSRCRQKVVEAVGGVASGRGAPRKGSSRFSATLLVGAAARPPGESSWGGSGKRKRGE